MSDTTKRYDKIIGSNLKAQRLAAGVSQSKLADELQITFQQVQKYENGTNRIGMGSAYIICNFLKITPSDLYVDSIFVEKERINLEDYVPELLELRKFKKTILKAVGEV
jgi:transcriptional regulator with XRE-family HTH domain